MSCYLAESELIDAELEAGSITAKTVKTLRIAALTECCEGPFANTEDITTEATKTEATTAEATATRAAAGAPAPIPDTNQSVLYNEKGQMLDTVSLHCARAGQTYFAI